MEWHLDRPAEAVVEHVEGKHWLASIGNDRRPQLAGPFKSALDATEHLLAELMERAENDLPDAGECLKRVATLCKQHHPRFAAYDAAAGSMATGAMLPPDGFDDWFEDTPRRMPPATNEVSEGASDGDDDEGG